MDNNELLEDLDLEIKFQSYGTNDRHRRKFSKIKKKGKVEPESPLNIEDLDESPVVKC